MAFLLEGTRVLNARSGSKVRFYFLNGPAMDLDVPHLYAARVDYYEAERLAKKLKDFGYEPRILPSGEFKRAVQVSVLREKRSQIEALDRHAFAKSSNYSTEDMVRMQFPPYSWVEIENGVPRFIERATASPITGTLAATDIETRRNPPESADYNEIAMNTVAGSENRLMVLDEFGLGPGNVSSVVLRPCSSEAEIGSASSEVLSGYSRIAAHNLPFDFEWLLEAAKRSENGFASFDEYSPSLKRVGNFLKIFKLKGKALLDTCAFSRNHLPLMRDDLESVYNYYFEEGYEKSLDYGEMDELLARARNRKDPEAAARVATYNLEDALRCRKLAERELSVARECALALCTDLTSFFSVSLSNLARRRRNLQYFRELNACRGDRSADLQEFDFQKEKLDFLEKNGLPLKMRTGALGKTVMVYPTQLLNNLPMVNDPDVLWLFNLMSKGDPKDRVIYAQVLDALCEEPFFDMLRCDNPNKYYYRAKGQNKLDTIEKRSAERARWNFKAGYGIEHAKALEDLRMSLKESAELLESYGLTPVNAAGRFLFLKGEPDAVMDDNQHFIVYGVPDWTLSVEKGVVAARLGRSLFGFGIDAVGNRGLRFDLEKELIADYFDVRSRQGQDAAQKRMDEMRQKLRSRQVPVNKLAYTVTRKKDVYSYSAYDTKRLKMINDLMLEQGQTARAVLCKNNGSVRAKRIENASPKELAIEEYDDILFGSEGSISRYYKVRATQAIMDF